MDENTYYWNEQGQFHREDGPAIEWQNKTKSWYLNGLRHRIDGPAVEFVNGDKYYFIIGKEYSYEDWLSLKDFPLLWQ